MRSTHLEQRSAAAGLPAVAASITRADKGPAWLAWTVPSISREDHEEAGRSRTLFDGAVLTDDGRIEGCNNRGADTTVLVVIARFSADRIDRVAFTDARCTVEAGARRVYWLDGARPADSVMLLSGVVREAGHSSGESGRGRGVGSGALAAIALTDDAAADTALQGFVQAGQPNEIRRDAAFWLGAARGASGARVIDRLVTTDKDSTFREHLTFVLTLTGDPGLDRLIDLARHDPAPNVRRQALFWLSQKAGERAAGTLARAVDDDPDVEVRKQAVFAISQLPKDEAVRRLIALAETHRDREVRKQALFWLGQSGDPRALALFERILEK